MLSLDTQPNDIFSLRQNDANSKNQERKVRNIVKDDETDENGRSVLINDENDEACSNDEEKCCNYRTMIVYNETNANS